MSEDLQQDTTATDAPTEQVDAPQLQLSDILQSAQIIQLASSRGAFKPEEFTSIGGVYERIVSFLAANGAVKVAPQPTTEASATEEPTSDATSSN